MPNNKVKTTKALQSKKTKIASAGVHPNSRRAKQLQRVELRTKKLEVNGKVRRVQEVHEGASSSPLLIVQPAPSSSPSPTPSRLPARPTP